MPIDRYAFAFGFLESAVHRALRELDTAGQHLLVNDPVSDAACMVQEARTVLRTALRDLQSNHGIELHWPDDLKEHGDV